MLIMNGRNTSKSFINLSFEKCFFTSDKMIANMTENAKQDSFEKDVLTTKQVR